MSPHTLAIGLSAVAYVAAKRYTGDSRFAFYSCAITHDAVVMPAAIRARLMLHKEMFT